MSRVRDIDGALVVNGALVVLPSRRVARVVDRIARPAEFETVLEYADGAGNYLSVCDLFISKLCRRIHSEPRIAA
jgi:hypothetical protein